MEKIINIDGKDIRFKSTAAFLLRYKAEFCRDALVDISKMYGSIGNITSFETTADYLKAMEKLDLEIFYNMAWVLAKAADNSIPPLIEWLDTFESFPIVDILCDLIELLSSCLSSSKKNIVPITIQNQR